MMTRQTHAILISIFLAGICNAEFNPYEVGSYEVKRTEISKWEVSHTLHVWSPDSEGSFPLVYGLTGFAGKLNLLYFETLQAIFKNFRPRTSLHGIYCIFAYREPRFHSSGASQVPYVAHVAIWCRMDGEDWRMGAKKLGRESHRKRYNGKST